MLADRLLVNEMQLSRQFARSIHPRGSTPTPGTTKIIVILYLNGDSFKRDEIGDSMSTLESKIAGDDEEDKEKAGPLRWPAIRNTPPPRNTNTDSLWIELACDDH
jgi:hypothetical protein